jgi:serine phosphatase RsbU (regulator of sigma subunit)
VCYTDGLVEGQAGPGSSDRFGDDGLVAELSRLAPIDEPAVGRLLAGVEAANGGPMKDDVALVVVSRRA